MRVTVSDFGSTLAVVVGLAFDTVDCALEKARRVLAKLQRNRVNPLVRLASILKVQTEP